MEIAKKIFASRKIVLLLLIINVIGFFYGLYYYQAQLSETPFYLWVFTLDSPLPVLFFAVVCFLILRKKEPPQILILLAIIGLIKYGFWTDLALILEWDYFFSFSPFITSLNIPLHAGMILEGVILMPMIKKEKLLRNILPVFAFFLVNDYLDYFFGTVTSIPDTYKGILAYEAFLSTILIALIVYSYKKSRGKE